MVVKPSGNVLYRGKADEMDSLKTLKELKFEIGDFLVVAITPKGKQAATRDRGHGRGHSYHTRESRGDGRRRRESDGYSADRASYCGHMD